MTFILVLSLLPVSVLAEEYADTSGGLTALAFGGNDSGSPAYTMLPSFRDGITQYDVIVPDYSGSLYCFSGKANNGDKIAAYRMTPNGPMQSILTSGEWSRLYGLTTGTAGMSYEIHTGANPSYTSTEDSKYTVNIDRQSTLKNLTVDDSVLSPSFSPNTLHYTAGIEPDAQTVGITATGYDSDYGVSVNGLTVGSSGRIGLPTDWKDGKMEMSIVVLGNGMEPSAYTLTLIQKTKGAVPVVYTGPQSATYLDTATPAALTVNAVADGDLSYQWYSNPSDSNEGGSEISGATDISYTPTISHVSAAKTTYYYCVVTNTADGGSSTASGVAAITVKPDPTPVVKLVSSTDGIDALSEYSYDTGDTPITLKAQAASSVDGGLWFYQWKESGDDWRMPATQTYTPSTVSDGQAVYSCKATYYVDGQTYQADSNSVTVNITATSAQAPQISSQPAGQSYLIGGTTAVTPLQTNATSPDQGNLSYQWYSNTKNSDEEGTPVAGATSNTYTPQSRNTADTTYYYCKITNTVNSSNGNTYTASATTVPAAIIFGTVADLGGTWSGAGTEASPYLIATAADLTALSSIVNQGIPFSGSYFKMTADLTLPDGWKPIGGLKPGQLGAGTGVNIRPFSGTFDGDGHLLTVPEGGLPLLGYVRGAYVKNLDIYGTKIAGYGLVNNYDVDYGPTGIYGDYTKTATYPFMPLTVEIDNVTLKSGTQTLKSGFIGGYASGANTVNLFGCTVETGVVIGYNKDQSEIGSFAGDLNGTLVDCVSSADVYGVGAVGGLVGMKGQSMGNSSVIDCAFHGTVTATGNYAGGIVGSGYNVTSAPNTPCVTIQNCWSDGTITGADAVGGLFGGEPVSKQCWANGIGYIQNNYFSGTVTATTATQKIGGIIGYMNSMDRYNLIGNNYTLETCGAERGIGAVGAVDSTTVQYGRKDDPTGAGAAMLSRNVTAAQLADGTILAGLNAGVNASKWVQTGSTPLVDTEKHIAYLTIAGYPTVCRGGASLDLSKTAVVAIYNDGTTAGVDLKQVTFTGFDSSTRGYSTVTASYAGHAVLFEVQITSNADYPGDVSSAKEAVSAASYSYAMADANSSDAVKVLVEKQIAALNLNGVTASVAMDGFTAATSGAAGSFSATVTLSKGDASSTASITGTITAAKEPDHGGSNVNVTFRLVGSTLSDKDIDLSAKSYQNAKYVTWIATKSYSLSKGSTMYDLFTEALSDAGLSSAGADSNYVRTINAPSACGGYALSEFTNGQYSGWMYTVNGSHPDVGLKDYTLPGGATVVWHYVDDYRYEVADWVADADHPKLGDGTYYSLWLKAADANPTANSGGTGSATAETKAALAPNATVSGGVASASVSASDFSTALSDAKKNGGSVVVTPKITGTVTKTTVALPKASLASLASDSDADLTLETPVGSITVSNGALSSVASQASGSSITASLGTVAPSVLTDQQKQAAGDHTVYDISLLSNGTKISSFGGKTITLSLPYTLKSGESASSVSVWYLNDAGKMEQITCKYDASAKRAVFTTSHLSYYVVGCATAWTNPFSDVTENSWCYDAVKYATQHGVFGGTTNTAFSPNEDMTRAMLVTVLYRLEGKPAVTASVDSFADVKQGQWYSDAVRWATVNSIVSGYSSSSFGVNNKVTREQLAAMLYRYATYKKYDVSVGEDTNILSYKDVGSVSEYAIPAMQWVCGASLIHGTNADTLSPKNTATRAQVATILMRFCENVVK